MYYKIIQDKNIIGTASMMDFRKWQPRNGLIVVSDVDNAQFIEYTGKYYYDDWFKALPEECTIVREFCDIVRIEEKEYNEIQQQLNTETVVQDNSLYEEIAVVNNNLSDEKEPIIIKKTTAQILDEKIRDAQDLIADLQRKIEMLETKN